MNNKRLLVSSQTLQLIEYSLSQSSDKVEVVFIKGDLWASQKMISKLFGVGVAAISKHIKNIFEDDELDRDLVISNLETTANDGKNYKVDYYNFDMIISVGYRVNSNKAVSFRKWATSILSDFAKKGFVIDSKRMENGQFFGEDYFEHLLSEIREIRLSERRFYQKVTDIFATACDYNKTDETAKVFFQTVQNKFHYAIHGATAAELIYNRADSKRINMGLTNWENAPDGKIVKRDVSIAKNYLKNDELESMKLIVSAYLDLAERRAKRQIPMTMDDWKKRLDLFLQADDNDILQNAGKISHRIAKEHAELQYEEFRIKQDIKYKSDFDNFIEHNNVIKKHNAKEKK